MYRARRNHRPSFMVVLTLLVALGAGISVAVQVFAQGEDRPAAVLSESAR